MIFYLLHILHILDETMFAFMKIFLNVSQSTSDSLEHYGTAPRRNAVQYKVYKVEGELLAGGKISFTTP